MILRMNTFSFFKIGSYNKHLISIKEKQMTVTADEIREIIEKADTMADMESLENDVSLSDQDVDSLDMANIFLLIEEKYGVKIPDTDTGKMTSVDEIVAYLSDK